MSIPGPPPKPADQRQRRNAELYPTDIIRWDGKKRGPDLPKDRGIIWCPMAQEWWEKWRSSPNAMLMTDVDWQVMLETAVLVNEFWTPKITLDHRANKGEPKFHQISKSTTELTNLAKEIRGRLAAYGATYEDRRKLRLQFVTDASEAAFDAQLDQTAEELVDYAERLNKKVAKKRAASD